MLSLADYKTTCRLVDLPNYYDQLVEAAQGYAWVASKVPRFKQICCIKLRAHVGIMGNDWVPYIYLSTYLYIFNKHHQFLYRE